MNTHISFDIGSSSLGRVLVATSPRGICAAGATASCAQIARRIDAPRSFRAVAQACGANPIALGIPCHRVVRNDGGLSGYRWGVARKRVLLENERRRAPSPDGRR